MTAPRSAPQPVPERSLGAMDMADGALAILRARPRTVAAIAAWFVLPTQLLTAWFSRDLFQALSFDNFDTDSGQFTSDSELSGFGQFGGNPLALVLQYAILPFLGVALTHLVLGWRAGIDRSARQCLVFTLKKTHIILAAFVLCKVLQAVTLLLTTPMLMLVAPVIAAESLGPIAAIRRSFALGRRRYGPLLLLLLLVGLVNTLLGNALSTIPTLAAFFLGEWGWIAFFALNTVGATVLNILGVGAATLAYIDVLNRTEGADIARRLRAASAVHA